METDDKGGYVGRGGLKLEAAVQKLGGKDLIRNSRAIDVGASTGGFTECLLKFGAREVTALEVGHGQLHEKLKADPRVKNLEKTNFKTVSLKVAPGPFDYFVVDVSFVAARTMLRPLAFRLRPGAEGVILVKPQFELPEGYVHEGKVANDSLRNWALQRVIKKGRELGFRLLGSADSPVALESGTVEILTRWRYDGPSEKLRGEKVAEAPRKPQRPAQPPRGQRQPSRPQGKPAAAPAAAPVRKPTRLPFEVPELPPKPERHAKKNKKK